MDREREIREHLELVLETDTMWEVNAGFYIKDVEAALSLIDELRKAARLALTALEDGEGRGFQSGDEAYAALTHVLAREERGA